MTNIATRCCLVPHQGPMTSLLGASKCLLSCLTPIVGQVRCISQKIFLGGLPNGTTYDDVKDFFKDYGKVTYVKVVQRDDRPPYGFIEFEDTKTALAAFQELEIRRFKGRLIYPRFPRKTADERTASGYERSGSFERARSMRPEQDRSGSFERPRRPADQDQQRRAAGRPTSSDAERGASADGQARSPTTKKKSWRQQRHGHASDRSGANKDDSSSAQAPREQRPADV